ncbi:MAG: hypothetical protein CL677_07630 [Bdellovibrionaceae bacterium]|nr:hypothetical protein [Pseudobdellovibrionaceae bacterium]|tara:strand:- start:115959 stop:117548 length:1590 start_codon:yes stop_codon:yes gene_type:complete
MIQSAILILFSLFFSFAAWSGPINPNPLRAKGYVVNTPLPAGANTTLILDLTLDPPHRAYSDQFLISSKNPDQIRIGEFSVENEIQFNDVHTKKVKKGIEGHGALRAPIEVAADYSTGKQTLPIILTFQACTDEYCLLPKKLDIPVSIEIVSAYGETTAEAPDSLSELNLEGNWLFEQVKTLGLFGIFIAIFFSGVLTSFTPCVFPVIPMTLAVIGHGTEGKTRLQGFMLSFVYVTGIALIYSLLGLFVASSGAVFGSYLGHPLVTIAIATIFFIMAASMFGAFDMEVPRFIRDRMRNVGTGQGYKGAFGAGLFAGIIASPCVGPVLVAILAFVAQTQDMVLGFALLLTFAYGLGLIFLVLGTFSSLIHHLPKSGMWMVRVKQGFGVIMIGLGLFYLEPLYTRYIAPTEQKESALFETYSEEKLLAAAKDGKAVIIDFWADWCAACIELEKKTFPQPEVQAMKDQFVFLKFDATDASTEGFMALQEKYDILGLPHLVFYGKDGNHRPELTLTGFEEAQPFSERMQKALQ